MQFSGKDVVGKGVYTIAEAARLTKLRTPRVREWFRGRIAPSRIFRPVFESDYPTIENTYAISFLDLIELKIAGSLRDIGVTLPYIRKVYKHLESEFGDHPFCTRAIYVGDKQIFTSGLDENEGRMVIQALTNQQYFDKIILPFLKRIDYDEATKLAIRWHIADRVVIDPTIRFGQPIIEEVGIGTSVLRNAFYANNQDAGFVADWFRVLPEHVRAAVEFEDGLAA